MRFVEIELFGPVFRNGGPKETTIRSTMCSLQRGDLVPPVDEHPGWSSNTISLIVQHMKRLCISIDMDGCRYAR